MTTDIKLKRSAVPGKTPNTSILALGELAINTYDGEMFFKKNNGVESIVTLREVTENNLVIDTSSMTNTSANNLAGALADLDGAITTSSGGGLTSVSSDATLSGDGTGASPLSVNSNGHTHSSNTITNFETTTNSIIDTRVTQAYVDSLNITAAGVQANSVTLGTDTIGSYVANISGTANEIEVVDSGSETVTVTIGLPSDVTINNLVVSGNLTISGTSTTVNTETINLADNIITLNSNESGVPSQNAGLEIERGTSTNVLLRWNETSDVWETTNDGINYFRILTTNDEGTGNGLDSDTLDGQQGSYYLDYNNFTNTPSISTPSISTVNDSTITITAGSGLATGGSFTTNQAANSNITLLHADTSTQTSLTGLTGANVVSDIDLDGFGHVTALTTRTMSLADFDSNLSSFVSSFTLPTVDGSNNQVLTTNGEGTLSFTTFSGSYSNSDVDLHLNVSTATANQVLSWTGSDYSWIDQSGGGGVSPSPGLILLQQEVITTAVSAVDFDLPAEYSRYKLVLEDITNDTAVGQTRMQVSTDGGATFISTGDHNLFMNAIQYGFTSSSFTSTTGAGFFLLIQQLGGATNNPRGGTFEIKTGADYFSAQGFTDTDKYGYFTSNRREMTARANAIRVYESANNFGSGTISLYAYKEAP